jgi:DNA-binding PadR family transcriptional regulator
MPLKQKRQHRHLPALVLLLVAEGPVHGGAVRTALMTRNPGFKVDSGAVYRTLKTLEDDGEVESSWDTLKPGPALKIYRLTPAGWDKLEAWKADIEYRAGLLGNFLAAYDRLVRARGESTK